MMKRNRLLFTLALTLTLLFTVCASAAESGSYVFDTAGLLSARERQTLEQTAQELSERNGFGVYLMTVDSIQSAAGSADVFDGATALYDEYGLGLGEERAGVLLLLSMGEREFALITYSDYGNYVFDQETREEMTQWFLDDFAEDDWYAGFADYLAAGDEVLADAPERLQSDIRVRVGMIFLIPLGIAAVVVWSLGRRMKSVAVAVQAEAYAGDGLELTDSYDRFTHTTETRREREEDSDSGGVRSKSSGGFGGTTGKF